jgi:hypothetical protein
LHLPRVPPPPRMLLPEIHHPGRVIGPQRVFRDDANRPPFGRPIDPAEGAIEPPDVIDTWRASGATGGRAPDQFTVLYNLHRRLSELERRVDQRDELKCLSD